MLLSKGVTGGAGVLRGGTTGSLGVGAGALVVVVVGRWCSVTRGLWVTTVGGLGEVVGGLRVGMVGFLGVGVIFFGGEGVLESVVVLGEILLAVTGGRAVVVVLLWSVSGMRLLFLGGIGSGRGGMMFTLGMAEWIQHTNIHNTCNVLL